MDYYRLQEGSELEVLVERVSERSRDSVRGTATARRFAPFSTAGRNGPSARRRSIARRTRPPASKCRPGDRRRACLASARGPCSGACPAPDWYG